VDLADAVSVEDEGSLTRPCRLTKSGTSEHSHAVDLMASLRWRPGWILAGLLATVGFLWLASSSIKWSSVWEAFRSAQLWPWLPLAVSAYLTGQLVRGVRCRLLVSASSPLPLLAATNVVVVGYGVNNILPARMGELARAGMLAQRAGISYIQGLTITLLERTLDALVMVLFFTAATRLLAVPPWMRSMSTAAGVMFLVGSLVVVGVVISPLLLPAVATRISRPLRGGLRERALRVAYDVTQALASMRHSRRSGAIIALSLLVWVLESGMFLALMPAFRLAPSPAVALLAMSLTNLGILAPSSPGFVGPFHFFCMEALASQGVDRSTALSYAVLVHATFFVPITVWAVIVMSSWGVGVTRLITLVRAARARGTSTRLDGRARLVASMALERTTSRPSQLLVGIVDTFLPEDILALSDVRRSQVVTDAADFVHGQLSALPPLLRAQVAAGLFAFRVWSVLRSGRDFVRLDFKGRRRIVHSWANGPVPPTRQLLRAIRSTALLALFEHSVTRSALQGGQVSAPIRQSGLRVVAPNA
jgi:uncharacterized protein (TIRG00374 family)